MGRRDTRCDKRTYWNDLRVKNGYKLADIAETLGTSVSNVGKWFSGKYVPNDKNIHDLCDLFGVDYDEGKSEFLKAQLSWRSSKTGKDRRGLLAGESQASCKPSHKDDSPNTVVADVSDDDSTRANEELLKLIYGVVSWDVYEKTRSSGVSASENLLELLYNKISFEEFDSIYTLIKSQKNV